MGGTILYWFIHLSSPTLLFLQNMGKALRYSWKCLVVGLQNLSTAYSMPLGASAAIVPDLQRARSSNKWLKIRWL